MKNKIDIVILDMGNYRHSVLIALMK